MIILLIGIGYFIPFQFDQTYTYFVILALTILTVLSLKLLKYSLDSSTRIDCMQSQNFGIM